MSAQAREELSRCIIELLLKEPFFGHLLAGVMRSVSDTTPTAAVALGDNGVELRINPEFFLKTLTRKPERIAVVKHECLHLLFKHLFRYDERHNARVFNLAADIVVNQFIKPWKLPEGAVTLETFPDLGLQPDQTAEWYYKKLMTLLQEMQQAGFSPSGTPDSGSGSAGSGSPGSTGSDSAGSDSPAPKGKGKKPPPTSSPSLSPTPDFSSTSAPQSADTLARLVGQSHQSSHSDHGGWAQAPGAEVAAPIRDAYETQLDRAIIAARDRTGPKGIGNLPGPLQQLIAAALQRLKPKVDWRRAIRIFAASSRRTKIVSTYRRESRRYSTPSKGPSLASESQHVPGIKIKQLSRLLVAIDTSGSVSDRELSLFFTEVHGIWRQGAEVDILECDAAVQRVYPYRGKLPAAVSGRGGTSFEPVFAWMRENRSRARYDGCIYLTDGGGPRPDTSPPCRLLWVVTSNGMLGEHLAFGRTIQLPAG